MGRPHVHRLLCLGVLFSFILCSDWKKGDHCLAPFEDDGQLYEAEVERIRCRRQRQPTAEITFVGWVARFTVQPTWSC